MKRHRRRKGPQVQGVPDGAASWSRVERIIARVEVGAQGADTRFIVTNLAGGKAKALYEDVYCRRGAAENHIKSWKTHLAADRTSCTRATANQFRLFLHAGAYWLMWGLRAAMPKRSSFAVAQFDTLRLRLIKIAARVVEMKTQIRLHLPTSCPTNASCASSSIAFRGSRHNHGAQTPRNEPADRNLQTPPAITTDHRRRLTRFAEKRPTAATSPLQAAKTSSPCFKAANSARSCHFLRL
ncbi:transposase [Mesorhizobium sp. M1409]